MVMFFGKPIEPVMQPPVVILPGRRIPVMLSLVMPVLFVFWTTAVISGMMPFAFIIRIAAAVRVIIIPSLAVLGTG